ncbi:hypothetical protein [Vulcanisaeta sp. JCM 14467]|nr:hypothetical protein [Vulcanisaeta sp. JCM 14467]
MTRNETPTRHELVKVFKDLTGEEIILNISPNLVGELLVETP